MKLKFCSLLLLVIVLSCTKKKVYDDTENDPVMCTEEYRTYGVSIVNGSLDSCYTKRISTSEIIRYQQDNFFPNYYNILEDSYTNKLKDQIDQFQFIGFTNGIKVIEETYTFKADKCHIYKVSGKDTIIL
jgi:hypothetical protein